MKKNRLPALSLSLSLCLSLSVSLSLSLISHHVPSTGPLYSNGDVGEVV